ncbi:MAG: HEPN domain-containing protein [Tannerellaceae bacterium]|jgi:HEPN domain-containing protein|nr:HEPN domain-containing protein [Tannerellaceae bacterium]
METKILKEWLYLADMDLDSAQLLREWRPAHHEIICYHCQQAAEKYLKGFLYAQDIEPPRIHDIGELCFLCAGINASFDLLRDECVYLTGFATQPRYPQELNITEAMVDKALLNAAAIKDFPPIANLQHL